MSLELYHKTCQKYSKIITNDYSTSFSLGIKTLNRKYHAPIYSIYGFVRFADEIVDTFHEYDKIKLLNTFKSMTYEAIEEKISTNPVLDSFQQVVNKYEINKDLIDAFLHSMEMDLKEKRYCEEKYQQYIYGSAEVVGLMCLKVFCNGNKENYSGLLEPARRLGAAFQKVNFLRDVQSDYRERGRIYFPGVDFDNFTEAAKKFIENDIEQDFNAAKAGIRKLNKDTKLGVYLAYIYYLALFNKIKKIHPSVILTKRIRITNTKKYLLFIKALLHKWFNRI